MGSLLDGIIIPYHYFGVSTVLGLIASDKLILETWSVKMSFYFLINCRYISLLLKFMHCSNACSYASLRKNSVDCLWGWLWGKKDCAIYLFICDCRMGMRFSSGSKEAPNWRSLWMHIVIDNLWSLTRLPSCLMAAVSEQSKPLMRYLAPSLHIYTERDPYTNFVFNDFWWPWLIFIFFVFASAGNGRWWWDWCHAAPDRWDKCFEDVMLIC